jgi:hypothetical protein
LESSLELIWHSGPRDSPRLKPCAAVEGRRIEESLVLRVEAVLPLEQAASAHRLLESRRTTGKL